MSKNLDIANGVYYNPKHQFSNPNLLINGDFNINQRNKTITDLPTSGLYFAADRWFAFKNEGDVVRLQNDAIGDATPQLPIVRSNRFITEGTARFTTGQRIEINRAGISVFGSTMTLSGLGRVLGEGVSCKITGIMIDIVNTGGEVTYTERYDVDFPIKSNNADKFEYTFSIPSKSYTEIDVTSFCQVSLNVELSNGSLDLTCMKLEYGSVATPFVADDPATNLAKCQRYYQEHAFDKRELYSSSGQQWVEIFNLSVPMAKTPRIHIISSTGTVSDYDTYATATLFQLRMLPTSKSGWQNWCAGAVTLDSEL